MITLPVITNCAAKSCSFNQNGCTAYGITVGGAAKASCTTLTALDARAGVATENGRVAVCQRLECVHNKDLLCTASSVEFGGDTAECLSYQAS